VVKEADIISIITTAEMTLRDLKRLTMEQDQEQPTKEDPRIQELIAKLKYRPFYIFGKAEHQHAMESRGRLDSSHPKKQCCFNHIIGLPKKGENEYPLFDYERQIFQALETPAYLNKRLPTREEEQLEAEAEGRRHEKKTNTKAALENLRQETAES
jgi:hypothetical protein